LFLGEASMAQVKMHAEELDIAPELVTSLLTRQFPDLADLPIAKLTSAGTENTIFRLGDALALRLPRVASAASQATRETRWLPQIAPHLPLATPEPVALGEPSEDYPWHWTVCRWLEGENAFLQPVADLRDAAKRLAQFVRALQTTPISGYPSLVAVTSGRGVDLIHRDAATRAAIARCEGLADTKPLAEIWDQALTLPVWQRAPVWLHGDLHVGNLLAENGQITGVIDWGSLGMGDPACDLMPAWSMLDRESRALFRDEVNVDDATWMRGRAWAVSVAAIALPYYIETNPLLVAISRHSIDEAVADFLGR
jgi:aminoglycoside phosphotransferase (APT) family kinase protein